MTRKNRCISLRRFSVHESAYKKMLEYTQLQGITIVSFARRIIHQWAECGCPLFSESIRLQLHKDATALNKTSEQLIVQIVCDWYGQGFGIANLLEREANLTEDEQKQLTEKVDRLWEKTLLRKNGLIDLVEKLESDLKDKA